jgi:hypothetical protein
MRDGVEAADAWDEIAAIPFYALPHDRRREGTIDIRGLFYASPATPLPLPQTVAGDWGCPDFSLGIVVQGDQVNVDVGIVVAPLSPRSHGVRWLHDFHEQGLQLKIVPFAVTAGFPKPPFRAVFRHRSGGHEIDAAVLPSARHSCWEGERRWRTNPR